MAHADPVKFAAVSLTGTTTATFVAAVTGKKIRLHTYVMGCDGNENVTMRSTGTATTALTGAIRHSQNATAIWPWNGHGWIETAPGAALTAAKSSTATQFGGFISYSEVD